MANQSRSSAAPLRVIHVLRGALGGSLRHVCDLVSGQAERGHQVGIVSGKEGGPATDATLEKMASLCTLEVNRLAMARRLAWSDFRAARELERICRQVGADIVHGHGAKGAAYARLVAPRVGAKAVYTPHGGSLHYSWGSVSGALYLGLERLLKSRTDGVIFASDYAHRMYEEKLGMVPRPNRVVHNGLHEDEFMPVPRGSEEYDFVFVGEIRRLKGIDVLLEAVAGLRRAQDLSLLIVGSGPDEARIRTRITQLGLADSITLSPPIHPARDAFAKARCVVTPSLAESLPYIVLEVLAARVPLVATRVGGVPEIFGPHSDSLLPAGDANALAGALKAFMADPLAAQARAAALHTHVKRHLRATQMVDTIIDFYREVLRAGPS